MGDSETGLSAGLYHLRYLSRSWEHVLSRDCYGRSMGSLSDSLLLSFLDPVMNATDISEPACQFVVALFCNASKGVAGLFDQSWENRGGGVVENEVEEEGSAAMMRRCESCTTIRWNIPILNCDRTFRPSGCSFPRQ